MNDLKIIPFQETLSVSYISARELDKRMITSLLLKGHEVKYYNNFIEINGINFNGWNEKHINDLKERFCI